MQQLRPLAPAQGGTTEPIHQRELCHLCWVKLTQMGPDDNPEAFLILTTFERVALASQWPLENWKLVLAPCLMRQEQLTYHNIDPGQAKDYSQVKATILGDLDISEETHGQCFRIETYLMGTHPWPVME